LNVIEKSFTRGINTKNIIGQELVGVA